MIVKIIKFILKPKGSKMIVYLCDLCHPALNRVAPYVLSRGSATKMYEHAGIILINSNGQLNYFEQCSH